MKLSVDGQVYDFDQDTLMASEAWAVQEATGLNMKRWQKSLAEMDTPALIALVWLLRRRNGERDLAFADVDFNLASLEVLDDEEPADPPVPAAEQ